jgi:hypothetical protein
MCLLDRMFSCVFNRSSRIGSAGLARSSGRGEWIQSCKAPNLILDSLQRVSYSMAAHAPVSLHRQGEKHDGTDRRRHKPLLALATRPRMLQPRETRERS